MVGVTIAACAAAFGVLLIRSLRSFREPAGEDRRVSQSGPRRPSVLRQAGFAMTIPLLCTTPFIITALIFHQGLIATRMGIPIEWFAASFVIFAAAEIAGNFTSGPAIDRFGAWTILPMHLVPFAIGLVVLACFDAPWAVPIYLGGAGLSAGMANTIRTAVVAEFVPLGELGAARGQLGAIAVLASAIGPLLLGWLFDAGASVALALWASLACVAVTSALAVVAPRPRAPG